MWGSWSDDPTLVYLVGFGWALDISQLKIDAGLLNANAKRWNVEAETTVTLRNIEVLLCLRVNGLPFSNHYRLREEDRPKNTKSE